MQHESLIDKTTASLTTSTPLSCDEVAHGNSADSGPSPSFIQRALSRLPMTVFWALAAQATLSITRLLTSVTVGGRFGPGSEVELGYYSSAFSVLMLLIALHEAFVTTPLTVFNQKQTDTQRKSFSADMLISSFLLIGLTAAITGLLIAVQVGFQVVKPALGAGLIAAAALAPLQLLREFSRRWLLANLAVKASAFLEFLFAGVYLLILGGLVYAANVSAVGVFIAIACVNAIGLAVWWYIYRGEFQFNSESRSQQVTENFRYGRWVAGENVCSTFTNYMCIWFLTFQIDEGAAGVFFACFTIMMLANPFLLGISSVLAPRAAQEYVKGGWTAMRPVLMNYGGFILLVLLSFAGVLFYFGDQLTLAFFGPKFSAYFAEHFEGRNTITSTLGFAMPLLGLSFVFTMGLLAAGRPHDSFYSAIVALIALIVANFSFNQPTFETAAISFVISIAVGTACRLIFLLRAYASSSDSPATLDSSS